LFQEDEGKRMIELLIDPKSLKEDFDDIDDLIDRLCMVGFLISIFLILEEFSFRSNMRQCF
jgi:hypothetical protein